MPSCGYVDNSPLRSELPTYPQLLRLGPRLKGDISTLLKRGHFYFGLTGAVIQNLTVPIFITVP